MPTRYPVTLTPAAEGGYILTVDDVPEAIAEGNTIDQALANAHRVLTAVLGFYTDAGEPLPTSSKAAAGQRCIVVSQN